MTAMHHVRHLAETIGPRGSTTSQEEEAAKYAFKVLQQVGLEPVIEHFISARSVWYPYILYIGLLLVSEVIFLTAGRWGGIIALSLSSLGLVSVLLELAFRSNPLRWMLPKGQSQNVWTRLLPKKEIKEQVVLLGHLDSARAPLIFSTDKWVRLFALLVPLGLISSVLLIVIFAVGIVDGGLLWRYLSLPMGLIYFGFLLLTIQAELSPYTRGANDNATGAGVVLSLANKLKENPLTNTAVWTVLTGCEEVGCYGADAFAKSHGSELGNAIWIAVDLVGGTGAVPTYITRETFLLTTRSDPELITLTEGVVKDFPELGVHPHAGSGAYSEGVIGSKHGFRVLTLVSIRPDGTIPEWHRITDNVENIDPGLVEKNEEFLWEILHAIDRRARGGVKSGIKK
jgi:hypothetical protein